MNSILSVSPEVGFRLWLGVQYREMTETHAVVAIALDGEKRNVRGVAHGGIVASLIDIAMGTAASGGNYLTRSRLVVTLEMKVNYLAPADGDELVAVADVVHSGSRTTVVRCEVRNCRGQTCAIGLGTFIVRRPHGNDPDHFRKNSTPDDGI